MCDSCVNAYRRVTNFLSTEDLAAVEQYVKVQCQRLYDERRGLAQKVSDMEDEIDKRDGDDRARWSKVHRIHGRLKSLALKMVEVGQHLNDGRELSSILAELPERLEDVQL